MSIHIPSSTRHHIKLTDDGECIGLLVAKRYFDEVAVNAYTSPDRTPADFYEQPGSKPFAGTLADGDSVRGVYVIRVPEDKRDDLTVVIDYAAGVPAVVFEGDFSDTRG